MRRWRPFIIAVAILLVAFALACTGVVFAAKRAPAFYGAAHRPADFDRLERSSKLQTRVLDLQNDIRSREAWGDSFDPDDLNAFLAENFGPGGRLADALPPGFHSPRVSVKDNHLLLGVKYREGFWSGVVWLELRVWLVADQTNVMAVEVLNLSAGSVPFGSQSILDKIGDVARDAGIDVTWYRHEGNAVGLFKFFPKQQRATSQILTFEIGGGKITVAGNSAQEVPAVTPRP
jgi:hypothetical protein